MPITDLHNEYEDYSIQWKRIRDCIAGEDAVKDSGQVHLPKPDNMLPDQYVNYLTRALFYGATGRTLSGLVGAVFRKRPIVQVPDRLRENLFNVTGTGVPFDNFAQHTVEETLAMGRFAVLVDRPAEAEGLPYFRGYRAEEITNWRTETINGEEKLVQCILKEVAETPMADGFGTERKLRYRVLNLTDGIYTVQIYEESEDAEVFTLVDEITPQKRGENFDYIPLQFFGSVELNPKVQKPPLIDLANVNISHYRTSADLEQGNFLTSQPTPYITGLKADQMGDFPIGSGSMWFLPESSNVGMLEYQGAGLTFLENALTRKQQMMAQLGARLLEDSRRSVESAETLRVRSSGESSVLANLANNCSMGLEQCLEWYVDWEGLNPDIVEVTLNTDFLDKRLDPTELRELVSAWQSGAIPLDDLIYNLQRGEILRPDYSIDDVKGLLEQTPTTTVGNQLELDESEDESEE